MSSLRPRIEYLKKILHKKIEKNNYTLNDDILRISQKLDILIVEYQKKDGIDDEGGRDII